MEAKGGSRRFNQFPINEFYISPQAGSSAMLVFSKILTGMKTNFLVLLFLNTLCGALQSS